MADINAVDLTAETLESLDGTENVVGFDTAEGKKIPLSTLADYTIQKKTQTVAGATQTLLSAMNAVNARTTSQTISSGSFNDLKSQGIYYVTSAVTDAPAGITGQNWRLKVDVYSGAAQQTAIQNGQVDLYCRAFSNNVWGSWVKLPTRTEMDAVSSRFETCGDILNTKRIRIAFGNTAALNTAVFLIVTNSGASSLCSAYLCFKFGTGTAYFVYTALRSASNITVAADGTNVLISNATTTGATTTILWIQNVAHTTTIENVSS